MSWLDYFTSPEIVDIVHQAHRSVSSPRSTTYSDVVRAWSLSGLPITRSPVPTVVGLGTVTGRINVLPPAAQNALDPTPVQLDDEVRIVEVEDRPHWTMGGRVEGVVRVCRETDGVLMFETHNIHTKEAGAALIELMEDSASTGETFTWSDIIGIAMGAVPLEE